jgi:hypothetical protein
VISRFVSMILARRIRSAAQGQRRRAVAELQAEGFGVAGQK